MPSAGVGNRLSKWENLTTEVVAASKSSPKIVSEYCYHDVITTSLYPVYLLTYYIFAFQSGPDLSQRKNKFESNEVSF